MKKRVKRDDEPQTTLDEELKIQASFYKHAVGELIDQANVYFRTPLELELPQLVQEAGLGY